MPQLPNDVNDGDAILESIVRVTLNAFLFSLGRDRFPNATSFISPRV
ncbi:hypothetical protein RSSM_02270 [Rhodopirellula sallentina SM41]|uniref:Uncharacterized protein n=1 Tax=Rhodopirellula sallentina SM41 TaxID=1263870 RepID=M5U4D0_9BACT|nr:hypothetical protein RSSM_02270 [Rhodopirellula sallentina SM41]